MITEIKEERSIEEIRRIVKETDLKHIAIIMDGNRRWAKDRFLPTMMGHKKGVEALKNTLYACNDFDIKYLTVYAFSTENWNRSIEEVNFLMDLLAHTIEKTVDDMNKNNVKLKFIGDLSKLKVDLVKILKSAENKTENNNGVNLQIAFNYGARYELVEAFKRLLEKGVKSEEINEKLISDNLYTNNIPDPDLLIRTGGEKRISNFLLWQLAYSEIYVTSNYWPEFNRDLLSEAIIEFKNRNRRFGV